MIYRCKAYQIPKRLCFGSFPKFCTFFKLIKKLIIRFFASIGIFGDYFYRGFHTVHRNDAYDIPLDS
jgi:hypothetical protein